MNTICVLRASQFQLSKYFDVKVLIGFFYCFAYIKPFSPLCIVSMFEA